MWLSLLLRTASKTSKDHLPSVDELSSVTPSCALHRNGPTSSWPSPIMVPTPRSVRIKGRLDNWRLCRHPCLGQSFGAVQAGEAKVVYSTTSVGRGVCYWRSKVFLYLLKVSGPVGSHAWDFQLQRSLILCVHIQRCM